MADGCVALLTGSRPTFLECACPLPPTVRRTRGDLRFNSRVWTQQRVIFEKLKDQKFSIWWWMLDWLSNTRESDIRGSELGVDPSGLAGMKLDADDASSCIFRPSRTPAFSHHLSRLTRSVLDVCLLQEPASKFPR